MNDKHNESLSALMDGELDELALHRILNELDQNPELKQTWSSFHLQRDAMKGELNSFSGFDISAAVSQSIQEQDSILISQPSKAKSWFKAVAGMSVAASVAMAVIIGVKFNQVGVQPGLELADKTEVRFITPEISSIKGPTMLAQTPPALDVSEVELQQAQERLNSYLKQHAKDSAMGQGSTAMPFARVVNFETTAQPRKGN